MDDEWARDHLLIFHLPPISDRAALARKGFIPLAYDTTPGYVDTQRFPSAPVKWSYQAIYRAGDQRVGQWSKATSVTVG